MHNTPEQNEAFRKAFDETNARWKAAVEHDRLQKLEQQYPDTPKGNTHESIRIL